MMITSMMGRSYFWRAIVCGGLVALPQGGWGATALRLEPLNLSSNINQASNAVSEGSLSTNRVSSGSSGQSSTASGTAWGRSEVGWLRFTAQGSAAAQSPIGSWSGQGNALTEVSWSDSVTVTAGATLQGQPGYLTATIVVEGSLGLTGGDPYAGGPLANEAGTHFFIEGRWNGVKGWYGASNLFSPGFAL